MAIYSGKVTLTIPNTPDPIVVSNIKRINWRRVTEIKPQTVMNTVIPIGWHQGHKHVTGELHVLSEAHAAFASYLVEDGDNIAINDVIATITDTTLPTPGQRTATFTGFLLTGCDESYVDGEDTVLVYRFVAYKVVEAPVV